MHITLTDQVKLFVFWIQMTLKVLTIAAYTKINTRKKKTCTTWKIALCIIEQWQKVTNDWNECEFVHNWMKCFTYHTILNRMIHQSNDTGWDDSQIKHNTHRTQVYN